MTPQKESNYAGEIIISWHLFRIDGLNASLVIGIRVVTISTIGALKFHKHPFPHIPMVIRHGPPRGKYSILMVTFGFFDTCKCLSPIL